MFPVDIQAEFWACVGKSPQNAAVHTSFLLLFLKKGRLPLYQVVESFRPAMARAYKLGLCSEFSVNARFHDKTVHILRSSEPEAEAEPPPIAARSVLDRLA